MKKPEKEKQDPAPETELTAEAAKPEAQDTPQKPEPEKQPEPAKEPDPPKEAEVADKNPAEPSVPEENGKPDDSVEKQPDVELPTPEAGGTGEAEQLRKDLLTARSQLAAYAAGVAPEMIQDAVILATAEAQSSGEVTEDAVSKAMEGVLKRHPEWKASGGQKTGGFRLGADPDSSGKAKASKEDGGNKKRWNRFK